MYAYFAGMGHSESVELCSRIYVIDLLLCPQSDWSNGGVGSLEEQLGKIM